MILGCSVWLQTVIHTGGSILQKFVQEDRFTAENSRESETFGHSSPELIFLKSLLHPAIFGSIVLPAIHPWELVWALPPGRGQQLHTWRSSTLCTHQNWVFPAPSPCQSPGQPPLRSLVTSWSQASSIKHQHVSQPSLLPCIACLLIQVWSLKLLSVYYRRVTGCLAGSSTVQY